MVKKMAADKSSTPLQLNLLLIALVCCISGVTTSAASGTSSSSSNKTCEYPGYPDPNNASVCIPFTQVCTRPSCPTAMASVNTPGQRGLPRYILSDANNASLFSVTGIILYSYNLSDGLHKDTFQGYPKLYTIVMVDSGISDIPLGLFFNLTRLAILTLTDNKLSTLPAGIFDTVPQLVRLTLAGNKLSTLPAGIFDTMPRLQYLFLDRNALVSVPNGLLSYNPSIVQLILGGNKELKTLPGDLFATNGYSRNIIIEVGGNPFITLPVDKWPSNTILLGFTNTEVVYLPIRKKGIVINGGSWCVPEGKFNCSAYKTEGCFYGCCAAGECPACSVGDAVYTPNGGITVHSATNITYYCDAGYRLQSASDRATCSSGKYIHPGCAGEGI
ncbi:leucine-rich alpha-2-glycoprotein-like [Sycon ciliatum]|uniref:leucine-rich alpha-2-glycoprotein-like n=1 Tax=Sycon ciliatum TaxID=27933 RepID=UPI0031F68164